MGNVYTSQLDYPKALEYYNKALKINQELGDKQKVAFNLGNMGALYLKLSQDSVSINPKEINEFVSLNKEINLKRAIEYSLQSIEILDNTGHLHSKSEFLYTLADAYKKRGDYKKAYEAFQEHKTLQDSVFNSEKSKEISALEKAREDDLNRIKIEKQEIQLAAQEKEKQIIIFSAVGGIFAVLIILGVIFNQRRKSEKLLLNILPSKIAKRLKSKEDNISDDFENATIFSLI